jgi:hypothetical protein
MKPIRIVLIVLGSIILIAGAYAFYQWNKPHRQISSEIATHTLSAFEFFKQYNADENKSNKIYLDKVVAIKGSIKEITQNQDKNAVLILETGDEMIGIHCTMDAKANEEIKNLKTKQEIIVKGMCTGMTLTDIVLIQCIILN